MTCSEIPLFPLNTVLFPDGYFRLRIFEQRYIDMVRDCSVKSSCFGVCLVNNSEDANRPATHLRIGTTAEICDFSTLEDGLLVPRLANAIAINCFGFEGRRHLWRWRHGKKGIRQDLSGNVRR